jgi:hypothetical protein
MKFIKLISSMVMILWLSACGPQYKTVYDMTPPEDRQGRMCLNQCMESKTYCEQVEHQGKLQETQICLAEAKVRADIDYDSYIHYQKKGDLPVEKAYRDFYHPGQCSGNKGLYSPRCESNYRQCFTNCGGIVRERTICVSGCDEVN